MSKTHLPFALALCLLFAPARAQQQLLPYLPEDTMMAVSIPDMDKAMSDFAQMPLPRIWREEQMQKFFAAAMAELQKKVDEAKTQAKEMHEKGAFPFDMDQLMKLRVHGATMAMTRFAMEKGDSGPTPRIGMLLHLDFGTSSEQWNPLIQAGLDLMTQRAGAMMSRDESKVGDVKLVTMTPTAVPELSAMSLNIAMLKNGVLIGTLKDEVRAVLENMQGDKQPLAGSAAYKSTRQHLNIEGAVGEMYCNTGGVMRTMMQGMELAKDMQPAAEAELATAKRMLDAVGLNSLQSMGMSAVYKDGKAVTRTFLVSPAPVRKGIVEAMLGSSSKVLDQGFLKWVPKDAVHFGAGAIDAAQVYDSVMQAMAASDEKQGAKMKEQIEAMNKARGFSLRDDLCAAMGDTYAWWMMPIATSIPEVAYVMRVNDAEKLLKAIRAMVDSTDGRLSMDESDKRGVKSYQIRLNEDPTQGMAGEVLDKFTPTFAFKDGWMVLALNASDVRRVFKSMDRKDDDVTGDIRSNKEFAAYAGQIPKDITSLSFTDWKTLMENIYTNVTGVLGVIPLGEDVPFDMTMLPDAATITKHMTGAISYARTEPEGYSWTSMSPFGPEFTMLAMMLFGTAMIGNVVRR